LHQVLAQVLVAGQHPGCTQQRVATEQDELVEALRLMLHSTSLLAELRRYTLPTNSGRGDAKVVGGGL
jgi:hypothetical protein